MRFLKALGVLLLLAVPCLLLAWGALAIAQTGLLDAGSKGAPAPLTVSASDDANASPGASGSVPAGRFSAENVELEFGTSGTRRRVSFTVESDLLKDVSDLSKATAGQLQIGDQYLESQTRRLAEQYAKAKDDEARAKLKGELAKAIERHFDVRHEIRKREIDELEARVKTLREHLAKRGEARQTIVQMRLGQFISAAEGLGWDADLGGGRSSRSGAALDALQSLRGGSTEERKLEDLLEQSREVVPQSSSQNAAADEESPAPRR